MNMYIEESLLIAVRYAVCHSVRVVLSRCINTYIKESVPILVTCVIGHSVLREV